MSIASVIIFFISSPAPAAISGLNRIVKQTFTKDKPMWAFKNVVVRNLTIDEIAHCPVLECFFCRINVGFRSIEGFVPMIQRSFYGRIRSEEDIY